MQAQAAPVLWDLILFWIFTGSSLLGLPPGDRDPQLISAVPPQTVAYFEWAARGPGQSGASGIDGFAADPEIRHFFASLDAALAKAHAALEEQPERVLRAELPEFSKFVIAHPGCVFLGYEPRPAKNAGLEDWIHRLTGLHGGAILNLGTDADVAWNSLLRLLEATPDFAVESSSRTQKIPLPFPGYELVAHREGDRIIFALGESTLPRTIDGLSGKLPGLDTNPRFREALARIATPRVSTLGWVDCQGIVTTVASVLGPIGSLVRPMLTLVGADSLDRVVKTSGVDHGTMVSRNLVVTGGRTDGIMVLFAGSPIQNRQLSHIPADADLVVATSLNLKKVYLEARQLLGRTRPLSVRVFDEVVKQLEVELGLKIVEDVLPAFGEVVTAFDSPSAGGMIATSLVAGIEVQDHDKAERVFESLLKLAEQTFNVELAEELETFQSVRRQQFLGHTICTIVVPGQGFEPHAPTVFSFCLTDRHLLVAVHPQALKAQLRFLDAQGNSPERSTPANFGQIASQRIAIPDGDLLGCFYLNGPRATGILSALLPYVSPELLYHLQLEGIYLDAMSIPSAAAITPYFGDATAVLVRQKEGLMVEARNTPPVMISLAMFSLYRSWQHHEFEFLDEARRKNLRPGHEAPEKGVVGAVAKTSSKQPDPPRKNDSTVRKLAPLFLKALLPEDANGLIPDSVFRRLEEGPSPEAQQRREEAKQRRDEARQKREDARRQRIEMRRNPPPQPLNP